jgi:hypothetical protein
MELTHSQLWGYFDSHGQGLVKSGEAGSNMICGSTKKRTN